MNTNNSNGYDLKNDIQNDLTGRIVYSTIDRESELKTETGVPDTIEYSINNVIINGFILSMIMVIAVMVLLIISSYIERRYEKARLKRITEAMDKEGSFDYIHLIEFK